MASHDEQALSAARHVGKWSDAVHEVPLAQQPAPQLVASQMQAPPLHRKPAPQGAPEVPHEQAPVRHWSAFDGSQATQLTPAAPHAATEGVVQVVPWQHPLGQDVPSHTHWPPAQRCPAAQGAPVPQAHAPFVQRSAVVASHEVQLAPATPHALLDGVVQTAPWQHPVGHEVASQTQ